jgi:hypothetical protein
MLSDLIVRSGSLSLLVWFVEYLKYPLLRPDCLYAALQGLFITFITFSLPIALPHTFLLLRFFFFVAAPSPLINMILLFLYHFPLPSKTFSILFLLI